MWPLGLTEREGSSGRFSDPGSAVQVVNFWRAHPGQFWLAPKAVDAFSIMAIIENGFAESLVGCAPERIIKTPATA